MTPSGFHVVVVVVAVGVLDVVIGVVAVLVMVGELVGVMVEVMEGVPVGSGIVVSGISSEQPAMAIARRSTTHTFTASMVP